MCVPRDGVDGEVCAPLTEAIEVVRALGAVHLPRSHRRVVRRLLAADLSAVGILGLERLRKGEVSGTHLPTGLRGTCGTHMSVMHICVVSVVARVTLHKDCACAAEMSVPSRAPRPEWD